MNENKVKDVPNFVMGHCELPKANINEALDNNFSQKVKDVAHFVICPEDPTVKTITLSVMLHEDKEMECMSLISQIVSQYKLSSNMHIAAWFKSKYG